jgi:hypothetical protein
MFRRLVVLALLGVAAATSDYACRTACFDASEECEAPCAEMEPDALATCVADCESILVPCMQACGRPDTVKPAVVMEQVEGESDEVSRELRTPVVYAGLGTFTLVVVHDDYPWETAWTLRRVTRPQRLVAAQITGGFLIPQGAVVQNFDITSCARYRFKIIDEYGDGILAPGYWGAQLNGVTIYYTPFYGYSQSVIFDFCY